ncbi:MAG: hypothetical protein V2I57_02595 [Xanthomonadales bacterium]|jgi:hypothetical protein|nr:hypothetical protein [Xanthomonadales bacterium]
MSDVTRNGRTPHYFFSSVTRNSDLWERPFEVRPVPRSDWSARDFVVGEVVGSRNRLYQCETKTGRMAHVVRGDLMIGALGTRAATLEGVGDWTEIGTDGAMDALTSAGLFGKGTSLSPLLPDLVQMQYQGHVVRDGKPLGMGDFVEPAAPARFDLPVILLIGTSMSAGKTTSGQVIIRALKYLGHRVVAAKLTGAARYRDVLTYRDAGADAILDFVDAGLPSTVVPEPVFHEALDLMLNRLAGVGAEFAVIEAGASPLEPYNGSLVIDALRDQLALTVLCASDPYAVLGVQHAFADRLVPDLVTGPAANTGAAVQLVSRLTGLPAMNLMDRANHPALLALLRDKLSLG